MLTILRTLEGKSYLTHDEEGRAHRYAAVIDRDLAQRSALKALTQSLFQGSTELLLTRLVADRKLTNAEIARIRKLLDRRSTKKKPK